MPIQNPLSAVQLLRLGIDAHGKREFKVLAAALDEYESWDALTEESFGKWNAYTRYFVDCWIDASNHEWQHHEPVSKNDWIPLAEELIAAISDERVFEPLRLRGEVLENY